MSRTQDFQKQEAKQSLWDFDGYHIKKRYRNKGKGRGKDKKMIRDELSGVEREASEEQEYLWRKEVDEAWNCHMYGPCEKCRGEDK